MKVSDILRIKGHTLFTTTPQQPLMDAVRAMSDQDIGSLVVLHQGQLAGMLTFREVLRGLNAQHGNLGDLPVSAVMVHDPLVCAPEDASESVRDRMTQQHVRYVPVVEGGRLLGVISFTANAVGSSMIKVVAIAPK